ncbi:magnesium transporter CorA family protein [Sporobolomyces salmoneus]|uniref:magnesium transporter CorA family protein n=1 Tax=Sporobolomyces salmoneus TaxID=183962 RepID=UPI00317AE1F0
MSTPPSPGRRVSPTLEPHQEDSEHSSPRPQSEIGLPDEHSQRQRDQDAHLAQSMTFAAQQPNRARSATLLNSDQRATSSSTGITLQQQDAQREQFNRGTSSGTVQTISPGEQQSSSNSRRRPSISVLPQSDATDAMGHLADDLEREDREEAEEEEGHDDHEAEHSYYGRESGGGRGQSSSGNQLRSGGGGGQGGQGGLTGGMRGTNSTPRSAAAARLYRHHRNLSDSSIDSQGGAYIDHRRQPHSLSSGLTPRGGGMARSPPEANYGGGSGRKSSALRRFSIEGSGRSPMSSRPFDNDPISSSVRIARSPRYGDDDAIVDEEEAIEFNPSDRPYLARHDSRKSYHSNASRHSLSRHSHDPDDDHHHSARDDQPFNVDLSRPGSGFGKPEDDICFPTHGAAAEMDYMEDHHGEVGMPGVLPNFPYPFDFTILEDFATDEREATGKAIPSSTRRRTVAGGVGGDSTSPPGYGVSSAFSKSNPRTGAFSSGSEGDTPASGGGGGGGRMGGRRRRLSESVAPGRHRPKVALFEGSGDAGGGGDQVPTFRSILDTRTPLLSADKRNPSETGYGTGTGSGRPPRPTDRKPGGGTGPRPYRFSFYSNALPSTIHARSLAEIPGEGQTFEELFVGRKENQYEDDLAHVGLDPRLAQFRNSNSQSGTSTPNHHGNGNGTAASVSGSVNGGGPMGAPAGVPTVKGDSQRTAVMRSDADAESNTWWLDVMCPTDAEMKVLSKVFGIHPLTTEDIQMEETREKIELFRNYYFVCFRSFEQDPYSPTYLEPLNMYIIVFREGTLSFHFRGTPHPQNVRRRIKQLKDYINVTSDWISYALIDDITDAFGPLIQNIEYEVDSIDELVLILKEAEQSDMLRRIGTCRKKVMGLLRLMGNKADVVKGLSKRCNENWSVAPKSDIGLYLSDIQDHITTSTQNLIHYEKILSRSHSNYLAQISIEMTDANNQINDVLSKLTALGTVLIPMNLVTGLWGMNVHVPGQDADGLGWFFGILGCLGAFAVAGSYLTYRVFVKPQ